MLTHPDCAYECHRIFSIRKQNTNNVITRIYTKYYCFLEHEYGVINKVRAKKGGAYFLWAIL